MCVYHKHNDLLPAIKFLSPEKANIIMAEEDAKVSFMVDPSTLTPEQKKDLITRNLQVGRRSFERFEIFFIVFGPWD